MSAILRMIEFSDSRLECQVDCAFTFLKKEFDVKYHWPYSLRLVMQGE